MGGSVRSPDRYDFVKRECHTTRLYIDNAAVIGALSGLPKFTETLSPLVNGYTRYMRQQIDDRAIEVSYIDTKSQRADVFTKPLGYIDHTRFIPLLSLVPLQLKPSQKEQMLKDRAAQKHTSPNALHYERTKMRKTSDK